jgi:hypothetical protein
MVHVCAAPVPATAHASWYRTLRLSNDCLPVRDRMLAASGPALQSRAMTVGYSRAVTGIEIRDRLARGSRRASAEGRQAAVGATSSISRYRCELHHDSEVRSRYVTGAREAQIQDFDNSMFAPRRDRCTTVAVRERGTTPVRRSFHRASRVATIPLCTHPTATTPVESSGALFARCPDDRSLPRFVAGSASTSALSGPARRSLSLRSACSPDHLCDPLHRRPRPLRFLHDRSDCYRLERKLPGGL